MNKKLAGLTTTLILLDIIDGDFETISILDAVKIIMYIICLTIAIFGGEKSESGRESKKSKK